MSVSVGRGLALVILGPTPCHFSTGDTDRMHKLKRPASLEVLLFTMLAVLSSAMLGCGRTQAAAPPRPPEVTVAPVVQQDVPVYNEWIATLDGYVNAQVRPQVSGYIIKQNYKEGSLVRKGEVLFEIDPRPFQAALDRAKGDLAQAQAQLGIGNLGGSNSILTSVSQLEPIKAYFPISERDYVLVQKNSNTIFSKHAIGFFGNSLELILTDGSFYAQKGKILLADRQVDPNTGTIRIVAAFPNPGNILRPGQYGRVRVETGMKKGALLTPQSAVVQSQGSYQVGVVGSDHKVSMRTVKPGQTVGTMWVIDEGLKAGEQVVVEGLQKLRDGTLVTPRPAKLPREGN